jgi:N-acetylglucosamine kinase-like BadF-type ATPase
MPDDVYPRIFPVIAIAADSGDPIARDVLHRAAQDVCGLVDDVLNHLRLGHEEFLLVKLGGTVGRSRFFDAEIDAALNLVAPRARFGQLRITPAEAAALAAKDGDGG